MTTSAASSWKRNVAALTLSGLLVASLFYLDLIDTRQVRIAFREHAGLLGLNVACLLALSAIAVARHIWVLRVVRIAVPALRVAAANLVSQAIGSWAPASMAVSELVRVGLLLGASHAGPDAAARIAVAALVDRMIGLGMTFVVGSLAGLTIALRSQQHVGMLLVLSLGCLLLGAPLLIAPLVGGAGRFEAVARRIHVDGPSLLARGRRGFAAAFRQIGLAAGHWSGRPGAVAATMAMSVLASVLNTASGYLTSLAVNDEVPFLLLAAILPLTIVSVILPLGFAGFGGPQLVAVALFALFGVAPKAILALTLVQNTLVLAVQTMLGLAFAPVYGKRVLAIVTASVRRKPASTL